MHKTGPKKLDDAQKNIIDQFKVAFKYRFSKPPVLCCACEMFRQKQADSETVDAYTKRLRSFAKRVDIDDATLLYALFSGFASKTG